MERTTDTGFTILEDPGTALSAPFSLGLAERDLSTEEPYLLRLRTGPPRLGSSIWTIILEVFCFRYRLS